MALLQVAVTKGNLAGIAGVWVRRGEVLRRGSATATDGRHDESTRIGLSVFFFLGGQLSVIAGFNGDWRRGSKELWDKEKRQVTRTVRQSSQNLQNTDFVKGV